MFPFGGTTREDIAYGRLDALITGNRDGLDGMIAGLPAGHGTIIGKRGGKLSAGLRPRLFP
ncbi:hypothetical protein C9427_23415 [Mesorhizobium helmanticense]|uniref:Uncharacterized protein n=1 Tax=Mesorhizobium helmanticense TaxID=1776423 RepID=A0A2T4IQJ7_9HYPH|nr:hypothetical protein C9427_23415 [Mesorhizobium helmanticense]